MKRNKISNLDDTFLMAHQIVYGKTTTKYTINLEHVSYAERKKVFRSAASIYTYALFRMNEQISFYPDLESTSIGFKPDLDPILLELNYLQCNLNFVNKILESFSKRCGSDIFCVLERHYIEGVVLEDLAEEMNISKSKMYRLIEKNTKSVLGDNL